MDKKLENSIKWMKKWEETRKIGKSKYIFLYGVLMWGSLTSLSFQIISKMNKAYNYTSFKLQVLMPTVFFMILGVAVGYLLWSISEKRYEKERLKMRLAKKSKKAKKKKIN